MSSTRYYFDDESYLDIGNYLDFTRSSLATEAAFILLPAAVGFLITFAILNLKAKIRATDPEPISPFLVSASIGAMCPVFVPFFLVFRHTQSVQDLPRLLHQAVLGTVFVALSSPLFWVGLLGLLAYRLRFGQSTLGRSALYLALIVSVALHDLWLFHYNFS
jgi:hypothetical protein